MEGLQILNNKKKIDFDYKRENTFIINNKEINFDEVEDIDVLFVREYTNGLYMYTESYIKVKLKNGEELKKELLFLSDVAKAITLEEDFYKFNYKINNPDIGIPWAVPIFFLGIIFLFVASKLPYSPRQVVGLTGFVLSFYGGLATILYVVNTISIIFYNNRLKKKLSKFKKENESLR